MRRTTITVLGKMNGEDFRSLKRAAVANGLRVDTTSGHVEIRMSGPSHDPDLLISNSPMGTGLRQLLGRSSCCLTSETNPGNGRPVSGILLCRGKDSTPEATEIATLAYQINPKTSKYLNMRQELAGHIEKLRGAPTLIDDEPVQDWAMAGLRQLVREITAPVPLVLQPSHRVDPRPDPVPEPERENDFGM